ncbi:MULTISPECIES: AAA family ATPase [Thalassospira]|uniref:Metallophosphoesterase n=2 Tax=Thalassospira TaxID=168934 RepID=A0A367W9D9_9PROT|nr:MULTISPECIES: AAA family ATPase [Thalassospira]MDG4719243.1 AAA family ATPase [Thalassospira sp. FZY0004]RCK37162.1 metallophosphoesterase [Thalassospira profundimaris]
MVNSITNLKSMTDVGIFSNRTAKSPSLDFRRYNLIYGFNGSGKTTLSRLFANLELGKKQENFPEPSSYELTLSDNSVVKFPDDLDVLKGCLLVFNEDYIARNMQWSAGHANPVFLIGEDQGDAAAELRLVEQEILEKNTLKTIAETAEKAADKAFSQFKRDRAKMTASRLYLGNRKYEAPTFAKDYDRWKAESIIELSDDQLLAAEESLRARDPLLEKRPLEFDAKSVEAAYQFISNMCSQSLSKVALDEVEKFPDMLLWLKHGHQFHEFNDIKSCLFCGNEISTERKNLLASAFDSKFDEFVEKLGKTSGRLQNVSERLKNLEENVPETASLAPELRNDFKGIRESLFQEIHKVRTYLDSLNKVLIQKQKSPATPSDMSVVAVHADVETAANKLAEAIAMANAIIANHNAIAGDSEKHKEKSELAIRKHFIAGCSKEYESLFNELEESKLNSKALTEELEKLTSTAAQAKQKIKEHGPAANVINKLIASYLGHDELKVHPVEDGYEFHRHGKSIRGMPSEGEKTAIAISYFLSSISSDGKKIKDLIIVIDDPVSSLDSKALNYACSLILGHLQDAKQLIVLTHNLQCMNEFRKAWKSKAKSDSPTATLLFIDVTVPDGESRRFSSIGKMSRLLRDYDSEYHFLFSHILKFSENPNAHDDHGYMLPNVLRRVLDVFMAFKAPGVFGLKQQIDFVCKEYQGLDRDRLLALDRLSQVESHSDNLDDLLTFSSMTVEETRNAANALLGMMEQVDERHLSRLKRLCRGG